MSPCKNVIILASVLMLPLGLAGCAPRAPNQVGYHVQWTSNCTVALNVDDSAYEDRMVKWGDGQIDGDSQLDFQHTYQADGNYTISLELYHGLGYGEGQTLVYSLPAAVSGCSQAAAAAPAADCTSPTGIKRGDSLFTSPDPPGFIVFYTQPSLSAPFVNFTTLSEGAYDIGPASPVYVRDGPVCADGLVWWKIQDYYNASLSGWFYEASQGIQFLLECGAVDQCKASLGEAAPPDGGWNP